MHTRIYLRSIAPTQRWEVPPMPNRPIMIAVSLLVPVTAASAAELQVGRHEVLLDLHGYNSGGTVVVPLAPLIHWLGATVTDAGEWTAVSRGSNVVYLQLPGNRSDGMGALVGLRDVAERLGAGVRFRAWDSEEGGTLGHIPHVEITDGDRLTRIIVHAVPPDQVTELLRSVDSGGRCTAYLLQVTAAAGDWMKTHEPQWRDQFGFEESYVTGVLHRLDGRWQYALRSSKVSHSAEELAEAGVPLEIARSLQMEIEE